MGLLGVAEVEVVGRAERLGTHTCEVGGTLEHRLDGPRVGVGGDAPAVAVDAYRQRAAVGEREHGCVGLLGPAHGARLHDRVVLLEQRPPRGDVRRRKDREQQLPWRPSQREVAGGQRRRVDRLNWLARLQVIQWTVVHQRGHGHVAHELAAAQHPHPPAVGDGADR